MNLDITNYTPDKVGRGLWVAIHQIAAVSESLEERKVACKFIRGIVLSLRGSTCKKHAEDFLLYYPPEDYTSSRDNLFTWTYYFHREANRNAGKDMSTEPTLEQVREFYFSNRDVISSGCMVSL